MSVATGVRPAKNVLDRLSPRQLEAAAFVAEGLGNVEIAVRMYLSEGAVKAHISNALATLRLDNRMQLMLVYLRATGRLLDVPAQVTVERLRAQLAVADEALAGVVDGRDATDEEWRLAATTDPVLGGPQVDDSVIIAAAARVRLRQLAGGAE